MFFWILVLVNVCDWLCNSINVFKEILYDEKNCILNKNKINCK